MKLWRTVGGLLDRWAMARVLRTTTLTNPDSWLASYLSGGPNSYSGVDVSESTALAISTVYRCVALRAGLFAGLPCHVVRRTDNGQERAYNHPLYDLLHDYPTPEMSSYQWREAATVAELLYGNAYAALEINGAGRVAGIWHLTSDRVTPKRNQTSREIEYDVTSERAPSQTIPWPYMLHIPGLGFDGIVGKSVIGAAREALGLALVTERHGASFFGSGARHSVALEHPGPLSKQGADNIRRMWKEVHQGPSNFHNVAVLGEGMKVNPYSISNEDSQFLQTRSFQVVEVCRYYGVPTWMVYEHTKDTSWGSGIEQQFIGYVTLTELPRVRKWEAALGRILLSEQDHRAGYRISLDLRGLLRGDFKSRNEGYHYAITDGWMTRNEVRELEDLNQAPGLDDFVLAAGGSAPRPAPAGAGAEENLIYKVGAPTRAAFAELYRATWVRILRRGRQDFDQVERGKTTADTWRADLEAYALSQLRYVDDAWATAGGTPSRTLSPIEEARGTEDLETVAAQAADVSLGGFQ